jgi:hypothetical protein
MTPVDALSNSDAHGGLWMDLRIRDAGFSNDVLRRQ